MLENLSQACRRPLEAVMAPEVNSKIIAGHNTRFTLAEENLLLLGLQRYGPDFPAISDTLMPNKPAALLR